jgi:hypothetical protein
MSERDGQVNRFAISLLAMAIMFAAALVIILTWTAANATIERIADLVAFLEAHNNRDGKVILTLSMVVVMLIMASVLILELTASASEHMRVRNVASGDVTITTARLAAHIDDAVRSLPHVADSQTIVARKGRRVEVILDLHVDAGADLAPTADEACRRAHRLIERLGVELASKPRARLHYRELRLQAEQRATQGEETQRRIEEQRDD